MFHPHAETRPHNRPYGVTQTRIDKINRLNKISSMTTEPVQNSNACIAGSLRPEASGIRHKLCALKKLQQHGDSPSQAAGIMQVCA